MAADKTTIGVTAKGRLLLENLESRGMFRDQMDAAKVAMAIAIRRGLLPGDTAGADTKWNVGSFDKDGSLRALILALFPAAEPYRAVESLIDSGLSLLTDEMPKDADWDVLAILNRAEPLAASPATTPPVV